MTKQARHLIVLWANRSLNLGDRVLNDVLERSLRTCGRLVVVGDPESAASGNRAMRYCELLSAHLQLLMAAFHGSLRRNRRATLVLPPGESVAKSPRDVFRVAEQLAYLGLLRALGVRVYSLGRDFESLSGINRLQELGVSSLASYYSLRDGVAIGRARAIGIRKAVWFPDLSWLSPSPQTQDRRPFAERSSVVLCFRAGTDPLGWNQSLATSVLDRLGGLLDEATEEGLRDFVLVRHADDDNDRRMTAMIHERYGGEYPLRCEPIALSLVDIPRVYGNAALVLSNRLHSLLIGFQWGAVGLALIRVAEQDKIQRQLLDLGLGDHMEDVGASNPGPGIVRRVLDRRVAAAEAIAAYRARASAAAQETLESLFG